MNNARNFIALICVALACIGVAASIRVIQNGPDQPVNVEIIAKSSPAPNIATSPDVAITPNETDLPVIEKAETITAKAYLVGNVTTGEIYLEQDSNQALPVASMSKLVTALAASTLLSTSTRITITKEEASTSPDNSGITAGETYTVAELMYPLLLSSSNVAAEALASTTNRANYLETMSSYCWEIGMPTTYFADASGLSSFNESSAKDLFTLAQYLNKYRPDILAITRTPAMSIATTTDHGSHQVTSTHPFVYDSRFVGGKTGRTPAAGETMLTILRLNGQKIAFIVLGSDLGAREKDTRLLIEKVSNLL